LLLASFLASRFHSSLIPSFLVAPSIPLIPLVVVGTLLVNGIFFQSIGHWVALLLFFSFPAATWFAVQEELGVKR
jgi:hypothetical protein